MNRMTSTRFAVSLLVVATIVGASAATSSVYRPHAAAAVTAGPHAHLMAYGGRSEAQQRSGVGAKFDAALADLARHASLARPGGAGLADLHAMNPAAHFLVSATSGTAYVAVDAVTRGDPRQLQAALTQLGMRDSKVYLNDVGGWLPLSALDAAAGLSQLHSIRASMSRTRSGSVTSQGDFVMGAPTARTASNVDGTGVTVGILSDSYDCYKLYGAPGSGVPASGNKGYAPYGFTATAEDDIASGDLPAATSINILEEDSLGGVTCAYSSNYFLPNGDEGRAMMQVVHDVAPGAKLAFHTAAVTEADFAQGIMDLADPAKGNAEVITDDVGYFDEPFFQDGLVAKAINSVNAAGVAYFSSAGNSGANAYDNTAPSFPTNSTTPAGEKLLDFGGGATSLAVMVPQLQPGEYIAVILEWDDPYVTGAPTSLGAKSQMDLCITGSASGLVTGAQNPDNPNSGSFTGLDNNTQACTGSNNTGVDPYQILIFGFPANATSGSTCPTGSSASFCSAAQQIQIQVGLANNSAAPHRIKLAIDDNGAGVAYPGAIKPAGGTLQGHPSATGAMAVGAAFWYNTTFCGDTSNKLDAYSARGGDPILFDSNGARLATAEARQKPDIVGPDGGSDTFLGFPYGTILAGTGPAQCSNGTGPNFFGTSAAVPHVAAVAALMLQKNSTLTPTQIYSTLRGTTAPMTGTSAAPDALSGYGFVQADAALAATASGGAVTVTLNLSPATINVGQSATLTWSSTNTTSCSATGDWPAIGATAFSGSVVVTPPAAGSYSFTISCAGSAGSAMQSQTLTVLTPSSGGGGGGGGALDLAALLALSGVAAARLRRSRRASRS